MMRTRDGYRGEAAIANNCSRALPSESAHVIPCMPGMRYVLMTADCIGVCLRSKCLRPRTVSSFKDSSDELYRNPSTMPQSRLVTSDLTPSAGVDRRRRGRDSQLACCVVGGVKALSAEAQTPRQSCGLHMGILPPLLRMSQLPLPYANALLCCCTIRT